MWPPLRGMISRPSMPSSIAASKSSRSMVCAPSVQSQCSHGPYVPRHASLGRWPMGERCLLRWSWMPVAAGGPRQGLQQHGLAPGEQNVRCCVIEQRRLWLIASVEAFEPSSASAFNHWEIATEDRFRRTPTEVVSRETQLLVGATPAYEPWRNAVSHDIWTSEHGAELCHRCGREEPGGRRDRHAKDATGLSSDCSGCPVLGEGAVLARITGDALLAAGYHLCSDLRYDAPLLARWNGRCHAGYRCGQDRGRRIGSLCARSGGCPPAGGVLFAQLRAGCTSSISRL